MGHAVCQYRLAWMFETGLGVGSADALAAARWCQLSADAEYGPALYSYGLYRYGPV